MDPATSLAYIQMLHQNGITVYCHPKLPEHLKNQWAHFKATQSGFVRYTGKKHGNNIKEWEIRKDIMELSVKNRFR